MLTRQDLETLTGILRDAARAELLPRFSKTRAQLKDDGSLITAADLGVQKTVLGELQARWPEVHFLGEEMSSAEQEAVLASRAPGLWVLDPVDGTGNFVSGIPFFGISLAFIDAQGLQAGLVLDPMRDEVFSALRGQGAWLNGEPLCLQEDLSRLGEAMAMVDFKRLPAPMAVRLATRAPYRSQRSIGSVALDWCWLAAGRVQVYLHGGQRLWDYAAGSLIFQEAGGCGGVYRDIGETREQTFTLQPRVGMGATGAGLFGQWKEWLNEGEDPAPAG